MPPLKGVDRGIDGDLLKSLEELGHGDQIVVVDPSYPIPDDAYVRAYHGDSSADALRGVLQLVSTERTETTAGLDVIFMEADADPDACAATKLFRAAVEGMGLEIGLQKRNEPKRLFPAFYTSAANHEQRTLFVRTRDQLPYACARFIVAAAQYGEQR